MLAFWSSVGAGEAASGASVGAIAAEGAGVGSGAASEASTVDGATVSAVKPAVLSASVPVGDADASRPAAEREEVSSASEPLAVGLEPGVRQVRTYHRVNKVMRSMHEAVIHHVSCQEDAPSLDFSLGRLKYTATPDIASIAIKPRAAGAIHHLLFFAPSLAGMCPFAKLA